MLDMPRFPIKYTDSYLYQPTNTQRKNSKQRQQKTKRGKNAHVNDNRH